MKSVRSQSDLIPRQFPELKRLIKNVQIADDNGEQERNNFYQTKLSNRKVGLISSNVLKQKSCTHRFQQPIIIEKKSKNTQLKTTRKIQKIEDIPRMQVSPRTMKQVRSVQKFEPIMIPTPDKKMNIEKLNMNPKIHNKQQIEIHLENSDKDCIKKLFKKIRSLTDQLHHSEKKNTALSTQIQFLRNGAKRIQQLQKQNTKLKLQIQKLRLDLSTTSSKTIQKIIEKPIEVIKHVPVEKIVQIQVPKYIQGPEKIIQKIVEVPVEKKSYSHDINRQTVRQTHHNMDSRRNNYEANQPNRKPNIDYCEYPIYKNTPYPFEIPIQVPVHVPVYASKPLFSNTSDTHGFYQTRSNQFTDLHKQNVLLNRQNQQLYKRIDILKRHNQQKNRQVQTLIHGQLYSQPLLSRTDHQTFTFTR